MSFFFNFLISIEMVLREKMKFTFCLSNPSRTHLKLLKKSSSESSRSFKVSFFFTFLLPIEMVLREKVKIYVLPVKFISHALKIIKKKAHLKALRAFR